MKFLKLESDILRDRGGTCIEAVLGSMSVKIVESLSWETIKWHQNFVLWIAQLKYPADISLQNRYYDQRRCHSVFMRNTRIVCKLPSTSHNRPVHSTSFPAIRRVINILYKTTRRETRFDRIIATKPDAFVSSYCTSWFSSIPTKLFVSSEQIINTVSPYNFFSKWNQRTIGCYRWSIGRISIFCDTKRDFARLIRDQGRGRSSVICNSVARCRSQLKDPIRGSPLSRPARVL